MARVHSQLKRRWENHATRAAALNSKKAARHLPQLRRLAQTDRHCVGCP
jgi:hypothetical protein